MNNSLVSIVIPTYKRPTFLERAIESVRKQTYSPIEIIVVDDNDPDTDYRKETEILMEKYIGHYISYIKHDRNRNGSAARNTGWRAAQGKYITFLDDDDEISPNKIKAQVDCLEALDNTWGACYTAYHIHMKDGTIQHSSTSQSGDVYLRALMRTLYMGSGSNVLLRKSVVDEIGGYDESFNRNQDIEFMARAFKNYKVAYVPEDMLTIHYEIRAINRTFDFVDGVTLFYLDKFKGHISKLNEHNRHRVLSVITLERARVACSYKEYKAAIEMLKDNNVTMTEVVKYICYLAYRYITKKSYGFYLK
jgi:glycosyltransferase involved in cell wall biosynthesis